MDEGQALELVKKLAGAERSERAFARSHGISQPYFSQIVNGKRPMSDKLLEAIGLERVTTTIYRRKSSKPTVKE